MSFWKMIGALVSDSSAVTVRADRSTHSLDIMDYPHQEIHDGEAFDVNGVLTGLASGTAGQTDMIFTTPNTTKWCHIWFQFDSNRKCEFQIWENPTVHVTGTVYNNYNRNRNHSTGANANLHYTGVSATNTNPGGIIQLYTQGVGATGIAGGYVGGGTRDVNEWILKQNEDYLIRIIPHDVDCTVSFNYTWYEHTNLD